MAQSSPIPATTTPPGFAVERRIRAISFFSESRTAAMIDEYPDRVGAGDLGLELRYPIADEAARPDLRPGRRDPDHTDGMESLPLPGDRAFGRDLRCAHRRNFRHPGYLARP